MLYAVLLGLQVLLGISVAYAPAIVSYSLLLVFAYGVFDIIRTKDEDNRAGYYALYLMGMEVAYRMGGHIIGYEMVKYLCILILLVGMIAGQRKKFPLIFAFLFLILLPSAFFSFDPNPDRIRKIILFNMSGPLSLVFSGMYFFQRPAKLDTHCNGLKYAFLPAVVTIVGLSLKSGLSTLVFQSVSSSFGSSGGFGPNQVSAMLGWFVLLFFVLKIKGQKIFFYEWADYAFVSLVFIRGLLTLSRGGMMGAMIAIIMVVGVSFFMDHLFRKKIIKNIRFIVLGLVFVICGVFYANYISDNFLMYRYMGLSTNEVLSGQREEGGSILTGRDAIMRGDIAAFEDYPLFGTGYGMSYSYHARFFGREISAHTEFTRLLSENGSLGIIYNVIAFLIVPVYFWFYGKTVDSKVFMTAFFVLSMMTMFHGGMRLALAGIIYGLGFMYVREWK